MNSKLAQLIHLNSQRLLLSELEIADTFFRRFIGLQFRRLLATHQGLLLSPCSSIHTFWMRFPIDVYMLDKNLQVVGIRECVAPWRIVVCVDGTHSILETGIDSMNIRVGDKVAIRHE